MTDPLVIPVPIEERIRTEIVKINKKILRTAYSLFIK